jgi:tetratricopeptide (TPR) repeat protein
MSLRAAVAALLAFAVLGVPLHAEEDLPAYGAADLALDADGVPEGWELLEEAEGTPGAALEAWAAGVAGAAGLDAADLLFETRVLRPVDGPAGTLLLVEADAPGDVLLGALEGAAREAGHLVRAMGHPSRLLVVAAPEEIRPRLMALEVTYAVRTLSRLAYERLEAGSRLAALAYARQVTRIDRTAGMPWAVLGLASLQAGESDDGIEALRRAFAKGGTLAPAGRLALNAHAALGTALLQQKDPEVVHEARDALAKAVALEADADRRDAPHVNRYNLACAHALAGEADAALAELEKAFALAKARMPQAAYRALVQRAPKDPDFASIRESERFQEIVRRASGPRTPSPGGI